MSLSKLSHGFASSLLSIGLLVSAVTAQQNCNYIGRGFNVYSQASADLINTCTTFTGPLIIEPDSNAAISLDGIVTINGFISFASTGQAIESFTAPSLQTIQGTLTIGDPHVKAIRFPSLTSISTLSVTGATALKTLELDAGLSTWYGAASTVTVQNTGLTTLTGINFPSITNLTVTNNTDLTFSTIGATTIGSVNISGNGDDALSLSFPSLEKITTTGTAYFAGLSDFYAPAIASIPGTAEFTSAIFYSLAMPLLTSIGKLYVHDTTIGQLWLPELVTAPYIQLEDNLDDLYFNINVDSLTTITELQIEDESSLQVTNCGYWLDWPCTIGEGTVYCSDKSFSATNCTVTSTNSTSSAVSATSTSSDASTSLVTLATLTTLTTITASATSA